MFEIVEIVTNRLTKATNVRAEHGLSWVTFKSLTRWIRVWYIYIQLIITVNLGKYTKLWEKTNSKVRFGAPRDEKPKILMASQATPPQGTPPQE